MRDIRFRGIDTMTGQWRFGDLVHNMKVTLTGTEPRVMVGGYEVKPETVGQYTGLKDTEGNAVYEGDVIEYRGTLLGRRDPWLVVEWNAKFSNLMLMMNDNGLFLKEYGFALCYCTDGTVVGNVHEMDETMKEACL